jgi:hypothetical protein
MGGRFKGSSLCRSNLRHLDGFAAAILLSARLVELGLKVKSK